MNQAVLLVNFGGPRNQEEILPFLRDLFTGILPHNLKCLAPILARLRYIKSRKMYDAIGGGSPVVDWTVKQAALIQEALAAKGAKFPVYVGMQYGRPSIRETLKKMTEDGIEDVILVPMYPYGSKWTMGVRSWEFVPGSELLTTIRASGSFLLTPITQVLYTTVVANIIESSLAQWPNISPTQTHILFSAHAIPMSSVKAGDPYPNQVYDSAVNVMKSFTGHPWWLGYQSRLGPIKWVSPSTRAIIKLIAKNGASHLLIVPLGFSTECVETLYELDQVLVPFAKSLGIPNVARAPALNDHPQFIDLLSQVVVSEISNNQAPITK